MKVLIVSVEQVRDGQRYLDDKGWSFGKSFSRLGVSVDHFFYKQKGALRFLETSKHLKKHWRAHMNRRLLSRVLRERPDVLLVLKGETIEADTLRQIRRRTDTTIINMFPDNPLLMGNVPAIEPCHHYFVKDSYVVSTLWKAGLKNVRYLPQCTDPDVHRPLDLSPEDRAEYGSDLCLMGSMYPYRMKLMEELLEFRPVIWGRGWKNASDARLAALARGRDVRGTAKAKAVAGAAVSLNPHHPLNDIFGVNRRTFDIAGCGGFQLADRQRDLEGLFSIGEEMVCFQSLGELKSLIRYYLEHRDETRAIASAARERVLREHTYDHRAARILELVRSP